jgi:S-adenosylmethionine:tRNA ribosyltransferase-isomerase
MSSSSAPPTSPCRSRKRSAPRSRASRGDALRVDLFDFELPRELIAERPAEPREAARLLRVREGGLEDRRVADLPLLLRAGDLLVFNDTKVIPARLVGRRGDATVEVTLHKEEGLSTWRAFAKNARRLRPGDRLVFAEDFSAEIVRREEGEVELRFDLAGAALLAAMERHGAMPLPPYIRRPRGGDMRDRSDYQTIFAEKEGAVAAPTAGLHFTRPLLDTLAASGIEWLTVTLHVGAGTFLPVKAEDTAAHRMHSERGFIDEATAARLNAARKAGRRIVAAGTTSLRLLESAAADDGTIAPFAGDTALFITPGYSFKAVDLLFTNFHLPRSTLFMLVAAFAGLEHMKAAYAHAVAERYRFFSYGDACLLEQV